MSPFETSETAVEEPPVESKPSPAFTDVWRALDFSERKRAIASKTPEDVRRALRRVGSGFDLEDLAALLSPAAAPHLEVMAQLSHRLTVERFGRTMQMYAPMYLTNVCVNVCTYCGFSAQNHIPRKILNDAEILTEGAALRSLGFDHVLLLTGEAGRIGRAYLANALRLLRPHFSNLSIEVQPLSEADYAALASDGLSAVLVYQETYDPRAYPRFHLKGPKMDMAYRMETPDRAGRAGLKKIGIGALYGLSDWRADAWFTGLHLRYLEKQYWKTKYSISFPRLRPHEGGEIQVTPFGERDLVQAACAFRLLSPEVELSLSTRESAAFRSRAFRLGFTSMSAGSRTNPGGYASEPESLEQFAIDDSRSPAEVAEFLKGQGYEPVWKDWDATYDGMPRTVGEQVHAAAPLRNAQTRGKPAPGPLSGYADRCSPCRPEGTGSAHPSALPQGSAISALRAPSRRPKPRDEAPLTAAPGPALQQFGTRQP